MFGKFYITDSEYFPAVVIKQLDDSQLLLRVWTDQGDKQLVAELTEQPAAGKFVAS